MWKNRCASLLAAPASFLVVNHDTFKLDKDEKRKEKLKKAINRKVSTFMIKHGIPGLSLGVSVNGSTFYSNGFGYSNVETLTKCTENTVMRIASISKPFTSAIASRLVQEGLLDLDKAVQHYLPEYPRKSFGKKETPITTRQLLSHQSGIRHYEKKKLEGELEDSSNTHLKEFLLNEKFSNVGDALKLFQDDDLLFEPGQEFNYTTHGFTLVSAILEKAAGKKFSKLLRTFCHDLGLHNTQLDSNVKIIDDRTSYYVRSKQVLENCQEVDTSYKWAGGGIISNVRDLLIFGNAVLFSFQHESDYFKQKTLIEFWKGEIDVSDNTRAALGWMRMDKNTVEGINEKPLPTLWYHTGGAVGASSALLISPTSTSSKFEKTSDGVCVVMLCNLQDISLLPLAREIESLVRAY